MKKVIMLLCMCGLAIPMFAQSTSLTAKQSLDVYKEDAKQEQYNPDSLSQKVLYWESTGFLNEYTSFVTVAELVVRAAAIDVDMDALVQIIKAIEPEKRDKGQTAVLYGFLQLSDLSKKELASMKKLLGDPNELSPADREDYQKWSDIFSEVELSVFEKENAKEWGTY